MGPILLLLHVDADGSLPVPARETVTKARDLAEATGAALHLGLVGEEVQAAADLLAGCGAARVLGVSGAPFGEARYATDALALEALCRAAEAEVVLAPGTSRWARALPGVAHRLGGQVDAHVSEVHPEAGGLAVTRWTYRQRIRATQRRTARPWLILLDPGAATPFEGDPGSASVEPVEVEVPEAALRTRVTGTRAPATDQQTIRPEADLLVVAGAGWTKKQADGQAHVEEAERLILELLERAQASLGGSKSLVDLSGEGHQVLRFLTHLHQVGQTGSTPRHPKGLATCCHGEEPHVVGWRFIGERRAVNLDPGCGWAQGKADVLYVADAFEVVGKLNELLAGRG